MVRQLPEGMENPQANWLQAPVAAQASHTLLSTEISVVTPLFGGGAVAREADPLLPVRGATVRGHLRFWWRACRGAQFDKAQELFKEEAEIWGSTEQPAALQVGVTILDVGRTRSAQDIVNSGGRAQQGIRFALFPFLDMAGNNGDSVQAVEGVRFRLHIGVQGTVAGEQRQRLEAEAKAAVWAWITFGGIGSRTRRGCGSLFCADFTPSGDPAHWLRQQVGADRYILPGPRQLPIPVLSGARLVVHSDPDSPLIAWNGVLRRLREMRQEVGIARNPGQQSNRPGRSRWPEPDSVRQLLHINDPRHRPKHPARPYFPRADLGLPLIFQRMDRPEPRLEAAGDGATRFASPFICKPLALSPTQAVPLLVCLNAPHVWEGPGVVLKQGTNVTPVPPQQLNDPSKARETASTMQEMQGHQTAREAVLAYVARRWNRPEVVLS